MGVLDPWHEQFEIRRHAGDRVKGCLHHGHPRFVIVSCSIVTRDKEYLVDLFPESFREPGILILRPTPVEDTGRNPALCENRFPVYQHDNLLEASFDDQAVRTVRIPVAIHVFDDGLLCRLDEFLHLIRRREALGAYSSEDMWPRWPRHRLINGSALSKWRARFAVYFASASAATVGD